MKWKTIQWVRIVFLVGCLSLGGLRASSWATEEELFDAVRSGDLARINALIFAKADVNAKDKKGFTALMYASAAGQTEVVRALIAAKADVNAK
ncbi:MAG TPA: ankyrin repeat domain-containing protein, partial [Candidatus Wunengus sp. YC61]|uniref:ankyrin repeat domain-containing protein n=1 Tax=Candidatus Wunengus sp. YC61 TaxID=3367698 RepID=UPI0040296CC7